MGAAVKLNVQVVSLISNHKRLAECDGRQHGRKVRHFALEGLQLADALGEQRLLLRRRGRAQLLPRRIE